VLVQVGVLLMVADAGFVKLYAEEIVNHNCLGMCCEQTCSRPYSYFILVKLNGLVLNIGLCQKHAEEFEEARSQ
jgi:hypothetical protein